jgi:hypothetical protein
MQQAPSLVNMRVPAWAAGKHAERGEQAPPQAEAQRKAAAYIAQQAQQHQQQLQQQQQPQGRASGHHLAAEVLAGMRAAAHSAAAAEAAMQRHAYYMRPGPWGVAPPGLTHPMQSRYVAYLTMGGLPAPPPLPGRTWMPAPQPLQPTSVGPASAPGVRYAIGPPPGFAAVPGQAGGRVQPTAAQQWGRR